VDICQYFDLDDARLRFSRSQASRFAKCVAGDFNPIHNEDAKRFCVPGDLLFAVVLHHYGVNRRMAFDFAGMVDETSELLLPDSPGADFSLTDAAGKAYLHIAREGAHSDEARFVAALSEQYVQFSGQTFPHILVDLMRDSGAMINPARPMVIYRRMAIELERFADIDGAADAPLSLSLTLDDARMQVQGKKGEVALDFAIAAGGERIGSGTKQMLLSGLRPYDESLMNEIVKSYDSWKQADEA